MMKNNIYSIMFIMLIFLSSCGSDDVVQMNNSLVFNFENMVGEVPLVIASQEYERDNGTFTVDELKYYISNVRFLDDDGNLLFSEEESYHLITQNNASNKLNFKITDLPDLQISTVEFSIGVDAEANTKLDNPGDLDPSNNMAWNWDTGYKFVLLEGKFFAAGETDYRGLVFHIGEDSNYKTLQFPVNLNLSDGTVYEIQMKANILGMFNSPNTISFNEVNVAMGGENARKIADNYENEMFSFIQIVNK
ncbi:hypothetical protein C9994_11600 [Marivirga lumbricoides]|uniref:Copper-binding protein MbnP-like domain-containing protein n=1 Tax=Marivirga lumbricoides TaxID=1046115 RepID=A0A2T4DMQ4_9BACT|nr:hypothetical protein C9994_11600 [Marivirga lumbricoides]